MALESGTNQRKCEDRCLSNWAAATRMQQQLGCVACLVHEVPMLVPLRSYLLLCIQLWPLFSSSFHTESGSLSPFCRCKQ